MTDAGRWLAIVNPASGPSGAGGRWALYAEALRTAGVAFEVVHTDGPHDGARIAADAVRAGRRRLLAAGGDGSVNDVVNGLILLFFLHQQPLQLQAAPSSALMSSFFY